MPNRSDRRIEIRMLGSLPIVAHFAHRLGIQEIIDRCCSSRSNAHLTHGQVALAIVLNRLTTPRGLYRVIDWAQEWALAEVCSIDGALLNDDRLGRCLDAIYPPTQLHPGGSRPGGCPRVRPEARPASR